MNKRDIRAALIKRGQSLRGWARDNDFCEFTVRAAVDRYAGTQDLPRGRVTFNVLVRLSRDIGKEIVPGLYQHNKAA